MSFFVLKSSFWWGLGGRQGERRGSCWFSFILNLKQVLCCTMLAVTTLKTYSEIFSCHYIKLII